MRKATARVCRLYVSLLIGPPEIVDNQLLFADNAHAVALRGFPSWVGAALIAEWYVSSGPRSCGADSVPTPVIELRSSTEARLARAGRDGVLAVRFGRGHLVAVRGGVRVDLAPAAAVVERTLDGLDSRHDPVLLTQTKVAVIGCLASLGVLALHAAGFEVGGDRLLSVGRTNSGKSTLATLALRQGGRVVSDDSLLVWREAGEINVAPLRRNVNLRPATEALLPTRWKQLAGRDGPGGRLTLARTAAPAAFLGRSSPRKLLLCRIDRRRARTKVRRIAQGEAMAGVILATSAAYLAREFPALHQATWGVLHQLISGVACFQVDLGRDVLAAPDEAWDRIQGCFGDPEG